MSSRISLDQYLSQKFVYQNRYVLNKTESLKLEYKKLKNDSEVLFLDSHPSLPEMALHRSKQEPFLCKWFKENVSFELHKYDFSIPTSYVTPLDFYFGVSSHNWRPWNMILFVYDPFSCSPFYEITNPSYTSRFFQEKDELFLPKSFFIEDLEIGWIGYDEFETFIFVHHMQIKGSLKGLIDRNSKIWIYRIMARSLIYLFEKKKNKPIIVPDASTYDKIIKRASQNTGISFEPYGHHVLKKSGFKKLKHEAFEAMLPNELDKMILKKYLNPEEIFFWVHSNRDQ